MTFDWQSLTAIAAVVAAASYLAYRGWTVIARKRAAGCGSCSKCSSETAAAAPPRDFVSLEQLTTSAAGDARRADSSNPIQES